MQSEVTTFRQQQTLQEQAAMQGLQGPAVVASHDKITKRMQQGAEYILKLKQEGKHDEAKALLFSEHWCEV